MKPVHLKSRKLHEVEWSRYTMATRVWHVGHIHGGGEGSLYKGVI